MTLMQDIAWALSIVVALFVGGYLKSYMGKKGENLATKEDVEKITSLQEEIKRKISGRQRVSELRREVAYDAMKITAVAGHVFTDTMLINSQSRRADLAPPLANKLISDLQSADTKSNKLLERLWELEGLSLFAFDEKVAAMILDLINSCVVLFSAARSDVEGDHIKATDAFSKQRGQMYMAFQKYLLEE